MGFEDYQVMLYPLPQSRLSSGADVALVDALACEIRQEWPAFAQDEWELAHLQYPVRPDDIYLVYETPREVFQMLIGIRSYRSDAVHFSLRFAYCNPRSIIEPFCAVIEGLMQRYGLFCHLARDLAPPDEDESDDILDTADVRRLLIPSIDYNRRLWFIDLQNWFPDVQIDEEAALRPGDAVERFVVARLSAMKK